MRQVEHDASIPHRKYSSFETSSLVATTASTDDEDDDNDKAGSRQQTRDLVASVRGKFSLLALSVFLCFSLPLELQLSPPILCLAARRAVTCFLSLSLSIFLLLSAYLFVCFAVC